MNPNPIRRSPSPLAPPQQPAQFIYATPSPTTTSPYATSQLPGGSPFMASTNGGSEGADGRPLYLCQPFIRAALVTGKFKNIVVLPKYVDVNEWVAINTPTYIDFVTTWIQNALDDPVLFPTKFAHEFPSHFPTMVKQMYRQLLRIFAHLFYAHYPVLLHLHSEGHFNSLFAHFLAFGKEFDILDPRDIRGLGIGDLADRWKEMGILES
ncbi:Maintenance of ploidy protein mob2 [Tulasnella sp. 408]|nr:Maintenance of ploidy protein mob2 [Tulasnella sp. 408]